MDEIKKLCDQVRVVAYSIARYHGNGYLEKVYERALVHRLSKAGMVIEVQPAIQIKDEDGTIIGEYLADLIVNGCLLVELKACKELTQEHKAQIIHYLTASRIRHGLLINFGSFTFQIKKFIQDPPNPNGS